MHRGYTCLWRKIWANTVLVEPERQFTRLEAWLFITNMLAAGVDNPAAGRKRGEFVASIRFLARTFNWSQAMAQRFLDQLLESSMIERVIREARRFSVCNYETYNAPRDTERYAERYKYKKGFKESKNKEKGPAFAEAPAGRPVLGGRSFSEGCSPQNSSRNLSAAQPVSARGEGRDARAIAQNPVEDSPGGPRRKA
jgi:hypothetical protein